MNTLSGEFKIQMEPQTPSFKGLDDAKTGRLSFRKAYFGGLEAVGLGEMLSIHCADSAHAGYVAIEQIKGTLNGLKGSFIIQHFGTKTPESSDLRVVIIAGSGAGELEGIRGEMNIRMEGKQHFYDLRFEL